MFESKNDIATQVLRTERIKTLLFISMINAIPISILYIENNDQETIKRGVVHSVAGLSSSQEPWQRAINGSFSFVSHEDNWFQISKTYAVSFTELNDRKLFFKHKDALRSLHFDPYYIRGNRIRITGYRLKAGQFEAVDPSLPARKPIKTGHPTRSLFCGVSRLKPVAELQGE